MSELPIKVVRKFEKRRQSISVNFGFSPAARELLFRNPKNIGVTASPKATDQNAV